MQNTVKQDINFLDKPLWMLNSSANHDGKGFVWKDLDGFEYRTGYRVPDKVDIVILLYLLLKSQQNEYCIDLKLSRYEILKECDFPTTDTNYYKRVEDSLKRWKNVALEFDGTFYEMGNYSTIGFAVIDNYKIDKKTKLMEVSFNKNWLLKIQKSEFFKHINFELYKRLTRPISKKLYELLIKNFKGRNECYYKLTNLAVKLTLSGRKNKRGEEVIYASDVLVAIKPAINDINKLALTPDIAKITGLPADDLFTIRYEIKGKGQNRIVYFYKEPILAKKKFKRNTEDIQNENSTSEQEKVMECENIDKIYSEAMNWLGTIPYFNQKRKNEIANMAITDIENIYSGIRKEYERLTKENKKPKAGWVYKAFTEKWQFSGHLQAKDKEEIKNKAQEKIDSKREEVKRYIEDNGGICNILYDNKKVDIIEDHGIYIVDENILAPWININIDFFKVVGN